MIFNFFPFVFIKRIHRFYMYNIQSVLKRCYISFNFVTEKMHCKIIEYTYIKDSDQTAHLRISDLNISIKDPREGAG